MSMDVVRPVETVLLHDFIVGIGEVVKISKDPLMGAVHLTFKDGFTALYTYGMKVLLRG